MTSVLKQIYGDDIMGYGCERVSRDLQITIAVNGYLLRYNGDCYVAKNQAELCKIIKQIEDNLEDD